MTKGDSKKSLSGRVKSRKFGLQNVNQATFPFETFDFFFFKEVNLKKMRFFFRRNHQQNIKVLWKRTGESKRIYEMKCREEVASNQFYHQEVARCGKSSKEAEKVRDFEFLN